MSVKITSPAGRQYVKRVESSRVGDSTPRQRGIATCAGSAEQLIGRYTALADIERGFKVLKSKIEIAPVSGAAGMAASSKQ